MAVEKLMPATPAMSPVGANAILLTGATGFLGSHLLKALLAQGYQVVCLKRSFSPTSRLNGLVGNYITYDIDKMPLATVFENHAIGAIIHTATLYGRHDESATAMIQSNVLFPLTLAELAIKHGVEAFINTDTFINNKAIAYSYLSSYTLSKSNLLDWLATYADKIRVVNCKLWHLYGPEDDKSKFIVYIAQALLSGVSHLDLTDGTQKRDFIYVDDVVAAYLTIVKNIDRLAPGVAEFELGSGQSVEVRQVITQLKELSQNTITDLRFGALAQRQGEYVDSKADISKLQVLGWQPQTSIQEGLLKTLHSEQKRLS